MRAIVFAMAFVFIGCDYMKTPADNVCFDRFCPADKVKAVYDGRCVCAIPYVEAHAP